MTAISRRKFVAASAAAPLVINSWGAIQSAHARGVGMPSFPWSPGFENLEGEHRYEVEVDGKVPAALYGTLFRNGPGINKIAGQWLAHWFDGDGMLSAIRFEGGRV